MNKKVLTLCAGVLLASMTAGTALAHQPEYRNTQVRSGVIATAEKINHIQADKWYQLRTLITVEGTDEKVPAVLVHVRDTQTGKVYLKAVPQDAATLLNSLWRIKYTNEDGVGGGKFVFVNKETNLELSYDHSWSVNYGEGAVADFNGVQEACNTEWEWYNNNKQTNNFQKTAPYAYTDAGNGQVMFMRVHTDGLVYSYKGSSEDVLDGRSVRPILNPLEIEPVVASSILLNPYAFNSMIDFNKASMDQHGEFKFYKPNGDLLNPELQDKLVNGGVMGAGQEYVAEYNHKQIADIYKDVLTDLGVDINVSTEEWWKAKQEYDNAESAFDAADADAQLFETEFENAKEELNNKETSFKDADAQLKTACASIFEAAEVLPNKYIASEDLINVLGLHAIKSDAEMVALKEKVTNAINDYQKDVDSDVSAAEIAQSILMMNQAVSDYYGAFRFASYDDSNITQRQQWWKFTQEAQLNEESVKALQDNSTKPLMLKLEYEGYKNTTYANAERLNTQKQNVRNQAQETLTQAEIKLNNAKSALEAAIGTDNKKASYILNNEYMRLKYIENNGSAVSGDQYLMVDTAFWQNNQVPSKSHLKLAHKTPKATDDLAIAARYYFSIEYFPTQDSLVVSPLNASAIADKNYKNTIWRTSEVGTRFIYAKDIDGKASQASNTVTAGKEIAVKLDELNTSELCLTASPVNAEEDTYLKTRIAFNNPYEDYYLTRYKLEEGLYFIKSKNTGKYIVANYAGKLQYDVPETGIQDYNDMPATMFVVGRQGCDNGTRTLINNREYGKAWMPAFEGQLYQDEDGIYIIDKANYGETFGDNQKLTIKDHFEFIKVEDEEALKSDKHGYCYLDPETLPYTEYTLRYNVGLNDNIYLNVDENNFVKASEGAETYYELVTKNPVEGFNADVNVFGYVGDSELPQLKRQAYVLKVRDANLVDNDTAYVALVTEPGQNSYYKAMGINDIRNGKGQLAQFYLKADQANDTTKFYTLVDIRYNTQIPYVQNGVRIADHVDGNDFISHTPGMDNSANDRLSAFALTTSDRPLYRSIESETISLFNSSNEKVVEDGIYLNYSNDESKNGALAVEGVVNDNELRMPQYLLGFDKDTVKDGFWCVNNTHGYFETEEEAKAADDNHYVKYNGYTTGRYLVNFVDSVIGNEGSQAYNEEKVAKYTYKGMAVRLGFVEGIHMVITADEAKYINDFLGTDVPAGEYFFTLVGGHTLADLKNEQGYIIPERLFSDEYTKRNAYVKGQHNSWSFSFRLIDDNQDNFLVESYLPRVSSIGSMEGAWIKDYSGCPVVSYISGNHETIDADDLQKDNIRDGEVFTLEATNEPATANESIEDADNAISVAATDGAVIVKGAEGKNVVVSTILGKVVANEVLNSDNETIAAPAGIVVVSVDGESFKVAVK